MTLTSSGTISMGGGGGSAGNQSINLELGYSATAAISLNDAAVRTLLQKASGAISLYDAYGKSKYRPIVDAVSNAGTSTLYATTGGSWSHTCTGTSTTGMLIVHVAVYNTTVASVTYGGTSNYMSRIALSSSGSYRNYLFYLPNPSTGTNNITVTYVGTGYGSAGAISFTSAARGIGQVATNQSSTENNNPTTSITPTTDTSIVVAGVITNGNEGTGTATPGSGQTEIYNNRTTNTNLHAASRTTVTSTSALTQSWSLPGNAGWAIGAAEVLADTGATTGQQSYESAGTYTFTVPTGVTSISAVCVGGGGGGGGESYGGGDGGGLSYKNSISVTPGEGLTVVVGAGGAGTFSSGNTGGDSYIARSGTKLVLANGGGRNITRVGDASYTGGVGGSNFRGAGGAAGYSANGGNGGYYSSGADSTGGGGGGGSGAVESYAPLQYDIFYPTGAGGGVGLLGETKNGTGGAYSTYPYPGKGGSGGADGSRTESLDAAAGGACGGGGGAGYSEYVYDPDLTEYTLSYYTPGAAGAAGGVRIIWGPGRSYPNKAL